MFYVGTYLTELKSLVSFPILIDSLFLSSKTHNEVYELDGSRLDKILVL